MKTLVTKHARLKVAMTQDNAYYYTYISQVFTLCQYRLKSRADHCTWKKSTVNSKQTVNMQL